MPAVPPAHPEAQPRRIAQETLNPQDDALSWGNETADLLGYLNTVVGTLRDVKFTDDPELGTMLNLVEDLSQEAQRRLQKFQQAAEIWQQRAERGTSATAQDSTTTEEG